MELTLNEHHKRKNEEKLRSVESWSKFLFTI